MKYLVVSDIHGDLSRLEKVLGFFEKEQYDMLIILGDIMNYGPRNGTPEGLNALGVADRLNALSDKIIAIRGNCDSEVDQMLLKFPMMGDYALLVINGKRFFLTHGHRFNPENMPWVDHDFFFYGHTHKWLLEKRTEGKSPIICNTGSITFPKGGNEPTFVTIEEDLTICVRNLEGRKLQELRNEIDGEAN